jgi:uncharacterized protein YjiS (DUF1127 family)
MGDAMLKRALMKIWNQLARWIETDRQRRMLRDNLTDLSKDIGVSRATLDFEASRSFWDN